MLLRGAVQDRLIWDEDTVEAVSPVGEGNTFGTATGSALLCNIPNDDKIRSAKIPANRFVL